jgi:hypothetical protein
VLERELIPAWGYRCVTELGRPDILDLIDAIDDRGAPTMARRVQAYVHRFFKLSVGRGIVADLPKPGGQKKRDRNHFCHRGGYGCFGVTQPAGRWYCGAHQTSITQAKGNEK